MLIAVAITGFDCFILRDVDGCGILLIGLALNFGYICMRRARDGRRRFWIGFEVTGLAVLLTYLACFEAGVVMSGFFPQMAASFLEIARVFLQPDAVISLEDFVYFENSNPLVAQLVVFEVAFGLPMLLLAACGGWLATKYPGGVLHDPHREIWNASYQASQ
jgi:hypothetical protein